MHGRRTSQAGWGQGAGVVGGGQAARLRSVRWAARVWRHFVSALNSYTCQLTEEQATALEARLAGPGFEARTVPHARFAAKASGLTVSFYHSGKLLVQGKGTREFVEFILEPEILQEAKLGYEAELEQGLLEPRIGVDESGKGDFFGPLVVAGVYVNEAAARVLLEAGVRDSKSVKSAKKVAALADTIRSAPGCVGSVVPVGPEAYNRMHRRMRNLNRMLAWGHAKVIENLLEQPERLEPPPVRAICDKFARRASVVEQALGPRGREIELVQRTKAEADLAVAAASILARHEFVMRLGQLGEEFGMELPKGAGRGVDTAAGEFVARHGAGALGRVAKVHFRTADPWPDCRGEQHVEIKG